MTKSNKIIVGLCIAASVLGAVGASGVAMKVYADHKVAQARALAYYDGWHARDGQAMMQSLGKLCEVSKARLLAKGDKVHADQWGSCTVYYDRAKTYEPKVDGMGQPV